MQIAHKDVRVVGGYRAAVLLAGGGADWGVSQHGGRTVQELSVKVSPIALGRVAQLAQGAGLQEMAGGAWFKARRGRE